MRLGIHKTQALWSVFHFFNRIIRKVAAYINNVHFRAKFHVIVLFQVHVMLVASKRAC